MGRIRRTTSNRSGFKTQSGKITPRIFKSKISVAEARKSPRARATELRKSGKISSKRISRSGRGGTGVIRGTRIGSGPIPPKIKRVQRPQPPLQKVSRVPPVTQFGSGGSSAIKNVFGLIEQTSLRSAAKKEQFKSEGRTGSLFFDSFFDEEFL